MSDNTTASDGNVISLVQTTLARPQPKRETFLRETYADHPDLFDQVWRRVRAEKQMAGFLITPLFSKTAHETVPPPFELGDLLAGRFRLTHLIGHNDIRFV